MNGKRHHRRKLFATFKERIVAARRAILSGIGFGVASGVNTTLGTLVGSIAFGMSYRHVVASVVIVALSDALSDAMSMHASEEMAGAKDSSPYAAMASTFFTKFLISILVTSPVFLAGKRLVWLSISFGVFVAGFASAKAARRDNDSVSRAIGFRCFSIALVVLASIGIQELVKHVLGVEV